jgi:Xaa-Pro aminopeptidase
MRKRDLAHLVIPASPQQFARTRAIARYASHVGGGNSRVGVVFPLEGEPTAFVPDPEDWTQSQPWCHDLRPLPATGTPELVEILQRTDSQSRRVGVAGSITGPALDSLQNEAADLDWIDLTIDLERIRAIKSAEEIAFLARSARIADAALTEVENQLSLGVPDSELWATVLQRVCALGSELPVDIRWTMDPISNVHDLSRVPTFRHINAGGALLGKLDAAWGGYHAGSMATFACGPASSRLRDLAATAGEVWNGSLRRIAPGRDLAELLAYVATQVGHITGRGRPSGDLSVVPVLSGCGLGRDFPQWSAAGAGGARATAADPGGQSTPRPDLDPTERGAATCVEAGWCFFWGLIARSDDLCICVGGSVVVEATGARRLGTGEIGLRSLGR